MMTIRFKIDSKQVRDEMNRRLAKTQKSEILMKAVAGDLENSTENNFKAQGRQPRWQRLKIKTLLAKRKAEDAGKILHGKRNRLRQSITSRYDKTTAIAGTNLKYARIHQLGGMAGRNHSAKIPARPFLKLTRRDERDINKRIEQYFA